MTPEQLLQPRYEVIADYPNSTFYIGQIITFEPKDPTDGWELADIADNKRICPAYPNIFKRLSWHEHCKPEDMPEYVKLSDGEVFKVINYNSDKITCIVESWDGKKYNYTIRSFKPCTLQDYTDHLTKTK